MQIFSFYSKPKAEMPKGIPVRVKSMDLNQCVPGGEVNKDLLKWHNDLKERIKRNKEEFKKREKNNKDSNLLLLGKLELISLDKLGIEAEQMQGTVTICFH